VTTDITVLQTTYNGQLKEYAGYLGMIVVVHQLMIDSLKSLKK
jgi:hypothetical protein